MPIGHNFFFFWKCVIFFRHELINLCHFTADLQDKQKHLKYKFLFLITMTTNNSQELLEENDIRVVVKNKTHDNEAAISSKMIYIQIEN